MTKNLKKTAIPGDSVAVPEEFLPGRNVYESNGSIRSLLVGNVIRDLKSMEIGVEPLVGWRIPIVGDYVTGQVESVQSSSANMKIYYLNGKQTLGGFSGTIFLRGERSGDSENHQFSLHRLHSGQAHHAQAGDGSDLWHQRHDYMGLRRK